VRKRRLTKGSSRVVATIFSQLGRAARREDSSSSRLSELEDEPGKANASSRASMRRKRGVSAGSGNLFNRLRIKTSKALAGSAATLASSSMARICPAGFAWTRLAKKAVKSHGSGSRSHFRSGARPVTRHSATAVSSFFFRSS